MSAGLLATLSGLLSGSPSPKDHRAAVELIAREHVRANPTPLPAICDHEMAAMRVLAGLE